METYWVLVGLLCLCAQCLGQGCWTEWFDRDDPSGTGDWELLEYLRIDYPGRICTNPSEIEVRTLNGLTIDVAGDIPEVLDTTLGFACDFRNQPDNECHDYRVRFFCPPPFCGECERNFHENIDFIGTHIKYVFAPDAEHCQMICTQHAFCSFFTFIRPDWTTDDRQFQCYLRFSADGQPTSQHPLLGVTSGFVFGHKNCTYDVCLATVYDNMDFYGGDYRSLFTQDQEHCQRACTNDPGCGFFTYINKQFHQESIRHKCHLKFSWTVPNLPEMLAVQGHFSGFSHKLYNEKHNETHKTCATEMKLNTEMPGHDLAMLHALSPEHCLSLCSSHPLCTFFTYFTVSGNNTDKWFHCYLKSNVHEMVTSAMDGAISGMPPQFCHPDIGWARAVYEGVDLVGNDIRFVLVDDAIACQTACTEDDNCQFFTYVDGTTPVSLHWRRCYMKRVVTMADPPRVGELHNAVSGFSLKNC